MSERLSAEEFARENAVSREQLRVWEEEGLVEPSFGERGYSLLDARKLDVVAHLEFAGLSADEIHRACIGFDMEPLRQELLAAEERLVAQRTAIERRLRLVNRYLAECNDELGHVVLNQIILEELPAREVLTLDIPEELRRYGRGGEALQWERTTRCMRRALIAAGSDVSLFKDVGYIIDQKDFRQDDPPLSRAFVMHDGRTLELGQGLQTDMLPAGYYLSMYVSHAYPIEEEGTGRAVLGRMIDYAEHMGYEVVGNYYEETLCRWYQALDPNNDVLLHACLPVRRSEGRREGS